MRIYRLSIPLYRPILTPCSVAVNPANQANVVLHFATGKIVAPLSQGKNWRHDRTKRCNEETVPGKVDFIAYFCYYLGVIC